MIHLNKINYNLWFLNINLNVRVLIRKTECYWEKMPKREYPNELEHGEWLRRQNYFLEEQNKELKRKIKEAEEYINILLDKIKILSNED